MASASEAESCVPRPSTPQLADLVDASAWLANTNRRDEHHSVARTLLDAFLAQRIQLATTTWTVYEALSMLKSLAGWNVAANLWALVTDHKAVVLVDVTKDIERRALDLFFGYRDKTWGVVDCANLVVMEDLGCRRAIGFDHHFREAGRQRGFELLPGDP